jgi:ubiquinone/menaquinone biosynthesis C-methylase UbiE
VTETKIEQHRVCPWWLGYLLASPIRRLWQDPAKILEPWVDAGMTILEPGPGMGFFTLELARRVGQSGRVIVVDVQAQMIERLKRRLFRAGLQDRVDVRLAESHSMGLADLAGAVDFVLAFAVVHELPSSEAFFQEAAQCLKTGGGLLLAEPSGHVKAPQFALEIEQAEKAGLHIISRPVVRRSQTALLKKG